MDKDEIKSHLETLADDLGIEATARQINKFVNLATELLSEADITLDEIRDEYKSIAPDDSDEWLDFIDEVADFVFDLISEYGVASDEFEDEE